MRGGRLLCEICPSIDVRRWFRQNKLRRTASFIESWSIDGKQVARVAVTKKPNLIILSFAYREEDTNELKNVSQKVLVVWTNCVFGGGRPWLRCPVLTCGRRVAIIYLANPPLFACRKCHDLAYATQSEPLGRRGIERARRIQMKLGGSPNLCDEFPGRPKGMHNRTYLRHKAAYEVAAKRCGAL